MNVFEPVAYTNTPKNSVFIDVRSPSEYNESTIEGAINIPIFSDEERALIGTMYKHDSIENAKLKGVEIVAAKLPRLFKEIMDIRKKENAVVLFCARGGYRSSSLSAFMSGMGERVFLLKGGYKEYRRHVMASLDDYADKKSFIVLHGNTGIGKTRILKALKERGMDILDYEEGANHRGSILGGVGLGESKSLKQFESYIFHKFEECDNDYFFVEAESRRIGKVFIPKPLHDKMKNGIHINLTADYDFRAEILIKDYTSHPTFKHDMEKAIRYLGKYVGEKKVESYLKMMHEDQLHDLAVELMINYYDPLYEHKANVIDYEFVHHIQSVDETADAIVNWYNKSILKLSEEEMID